MEDVGPGCAALQTAGGAEHLQAQGRGPRSSLHTVCGSGPRAGVGEQGAAATGGDPALRSPVLLLTQWRAPWGLGADLAEMPSPKQGNHGRGSLSVTLCGGRCQAVHM